MMKKDIINLDARPALHIININTCGRQTCYKLMDGNLTYNDTFQGVTTVIFDGAVIVIFFKEE